MLIQEKFIKNQLVETLTLRPLDNTRLASLCGQYDEHLQMIETYCDVKIHNRGNFFQIYGSEKNIHQVKLLLEALYALTLEDSALSPEKVHLTLQTALNYSLENLPETPRIQTKHAQITPLGTHQIQYVNNILKHDINFAIGPAGTGKTYLAVACAVQALENHQVNRILLVRPAVEAGERLGFLPGDLAQKVDPYLRPLYDALYEMLGFERVQSYVEKNMIEIAPLAYMRGRTLNDAFIILDESQNTTKEQMKMFLTRIGFDSIAVITGDLTQIDLPKGIRSGLSHAAEVLKNIAGISFTEFTEKDVVRHPLVQKIIQAYAKFEKKHL